MHWANKYIGKPWAKGQFGPEAFNCFGLVYYIYKTQYHIKLPILLIPEKNKVAIEKVIKRHPERNRFFEVKQPKEGDIVIMNDTHCGIIIRPHKLGILHAYKPYGGVVFQDIFKCALFWDMIYLRREA